MTSAGSSTPPDRTHGTEATPATARPPTSSWAMPTAASSDASGRPPSQPREPHSCLRGLVSSRGRLPLRTARTTMVTKATTLRDAPARTPTMRLLPHRKGLRHQAEDGPDHNLPRAGAADRKAPAKPDPRPGWAARTAAATTTRAHAAAAGRIGRRMRLRLPPLPPCPLLPLARRESTPPPMPAHAQRARLSRRNSSTIIVVPRVLLGSGPLRI